MIIIGDVFCLYGGNDYWKKFINYYQVNKLIFEPKIISKDENGKEYSIDELKGLKIFGEDNLEDVEVHYPEYDFDASGNEPNINEDLLYNYECSENVYAEGNKKYYKKKKEKKNKNKNKKKKNYYYK